MAKEILAGIDFAGLIEALTNFINTLGLKDALFTIFFFGAHFWVFRLYNGRLEDRQKEIDRIAIDNRDLRDRFTKLLDKHYGYEPPANPEGGS